MRIIAVDDEFLALEDFEDTCREVGITDEIIKFNNPLDALSYAATNKVDIAFLDIEMPVIKGIELARRIKAINRNVRIIFATSYGNYALEAFGVDAVDYVMKPYEPEAIKKAYENIAKADLYFGRAQSSRNYGYWKYASDFMGIGVSSSKKETYKKFSKIQTPTIFTLMGRNRGKRNLRDGIAEKMSEKMHISHAIAISMFPYLEIMFQNDELAWEISDFLDLEDNEIKRFRKKRI